MKQISPSVVKVLCTLIQSLVISSATATNAPNSPIEPSTIKNSEFNPVGLSLAAPFDDFVRHTIKIATAISKTKGKILNANIMWKASDIFQPEIGRYDI